MYDYYSVSAPHYMWHILRVYICFFSFTGPKMKSICGPGAVLNGLYPGASFIPDIDVDNFDIIGLN